MKMPVQLAEGVALEEYNALGPQDVDSVGDMFTDYLLEEFRRLGEMAFGNPVAGYLTTWIIRCDGADAGFVSLDSDKHAVELIYVKPEFRGRGFARMVLQELRTYKPQTLALKTPLSPGGEALLEQLQLDRADNFPHEVAKNEEALQTILESIKKGCPHTKKKQGGDPRKPCRRCYQTGLRRYATVVVLQHAGTSRMMSGRYRPGG
ncbi:GNAT family N-acetyltransferase [Streptomyces longwoodensis]|uniref:GNAT family N-acetyltransferase n=1 Tax=Streptomyces longwoodensis TaxID=68231 RepID=UPI00225B3073|nr:GNAT family N-acetyltransferase [Streptomyces longwoodensis]MCX5000958.1 GNAT family N-acetyltransferase [Streptomyces longwoodensis]